LKKISEDCSHCWLVQLVNDCADDVFTLDIGIDKPKED